MSISLNEPFMTYAEKLFIYYGNWITKGQGQQFSITFLNCLNNYVQRDANILCLHKKCSNSVTFGSSNRIKYISYNYVLAL